MHLRCQRYSTVAILSSVLQGRVNELSRDSRGRGVGEQECSGSFTRLSGGIDLHGFPSTPSSSKNTQRQHSPFILSSPHVIRLH